MKALRYVVLALIPVAAIAQDRPFQSDPIGARGVLCSSDSGTEIKDTRTIRAPSGYFFTDINPVALEPTQSYAGGQIGCNDMGIENADMVATVNGRQMTIKVPVAITIFAHADCGSGMGPVLSRWHITAYCAAKGTIAPMGR